MLRIKRELEVMTYLREVRENDHDSTDNPLFLTWPISKFGLYLFLLFFDKQNKLIWCNFFYFLVENVSYIANSYHGELEIRKQVKERIGLSRDLDEFTLYESAWMQEPMIFPEVISCKIEAALLETGLR
jgi:hypothetical protein